MHFQTLCNKDTKYILGTESMITNDENWILGAGDTGIKFEQIRSEK